MTRGEVVLNTLERMEQMCKEVGSEVRRSGEFGAMIELYEDLKAIRRVKRLFNAKEDESDNSNKE